jgi:hypothetical protein
MKVSALPTSASGVLGTDLGAVNLGRTASPEKMAAAKAIAAGQTPPVVDSQVERIQQNIKKIRMKTNVSPDQYEPTDETQGAIPDSIVPATETEVTQPISPQLAALAKQRRAFQLEKEAFAREKAAAAANPTEGAAELIAKLKAQPLSVLQEHGVTYDQLTEAILGNPVNPEIESLKEQIKALKEGVDNSFKTQAEGQEEAALTEMLYEAESLAKEGESYELIRTRNAYDRVLRKIHGNFKKTGRVLDVSEAMTQVENELLEEGLKIAEASKIKNKLIPTQQPAPQPQQRTMRTLTNRDGAIPPLDRKSRAMAAFRGTLKG